MLTLVALTSGCDPSSPAAATSSSAAASSPPASPSAGTSPTAAADLAAEGTTGRPASVQLSAAPPAAGVPSLISAKCGLADAAAEYVTVTLLFTDRGPTSRAEPVSSNLQADVSVVGSSGVGVAERTDIERSSTPADYCPGTAALPDRTTVQTEELADEHQSMTLYVMALTSASDQDPLAGVTLRLTDPRVSANDINPQPWTWDVQHVTTGATCQDDPNSLCLPLA